MLTAPDTFIQIAPDSTAERGVVPESAREPKPAYLIEYELLAGTPYRYTNDELLFEVHVRRMALGEAELEAQRDELWREFFAKSHACMRASALAKKFGWGVHSDAEGRLALVARDSEAYRRFVEAGERGELKLTAAMRSRRAAR
jgi:hypothetical protein